MQGRDSNRRSKSPSSFFKTPEVIKINSNVMKRLWKKALDHPSFSIPFFNLFFASLLFVMFSFDSLLIYLVDRTASSLKSFLVSGMIGVAVAEIAFIFVVIVCRLPKK